MRLSGYRIMWVLTFFDLPTKTEKEKKAYTKFRKSLLKDGFAMLQYSVYIRHCTSYESMDAHVSRVERNLPDVGKVSILTVTDKQFENIKHFWGVEQVDPPGTPQQIEMF